MKALLLLLIVLGVGADVGLDDITWRDYVDTNIKALENTVTALERSLDQRLTRSEYQIADQSRMQDIEAVREQSARAQWLSMAAATAAIIGTAIMIMAKLKPISSSD